MRLLSWNVAGRVGDTLLRQIERVLADAADIVCLQEVTPTTQAAWEAALGSEGRPALTSPWVVPPRGSRRLAVLSAGPAPMEPARAPALPWPERHLVVRVGRPALIVHNLHAPLSSKPDLVKVLTFEALGAALAAERRPALLAGDLNTPQYESREGEVQSFAVTRSGRIRPALGERHDRAERGVITGLTGAGWRDAFRSLHGYGRRDRSWKPAFRHPGYRLDHVLVSPGVRVLGCDYRHEWREEGLSDHSAIWAEVEVDERTRPGGGAGPAGG